MLKKTLCTNLGPDALKGPKYTEVHWLESMASVWREADNHDIVPHGCIDCLEGDVAVMTII